MSRLLFLSIFLLQIHTLFASEDLISKKHDTKRKESRVGIDFVSAKKISSNSKYSVFSSFDPKHHKTILWFHGFPVGEEISLSIRRTAQINPENYSPTYKFTLLEDGTLLDSKKENATHFCISSGGYLPGERIYCYLETRDEKFVKEISFIPNPIDITDSSGEPILEAELVSLKPTVYQINITGFNEDERFIFKSKAGALVNEIVEKFTKDGVTLTYSPELKGKKGGESIVEIRRQSGKKYTLKFPWGNRLTAFLDREKVFNAR